jgi:hypothetical protein
MKNYITKLLTAWLGLDAIRVELAQLDAKATSARNQLIGLTRRAEVVEAQVAGHAERVTRVEKANLPVRYVQTSTGLQEVR